MEYLHGRRLKSDFWAWWLMFYHQNPRIISTGLNFEFRGRNLNVFWGKVHSFSKGRAVWRSWVLVIFCDINNLGEKWRNNSIYLDIFMKWQLKHIFCKFQYCDYNNLWGNLQNMCIQVSLRNPFALWPALSMLKHCDDRSRSITSDNYAISNDYFCFIFHMCISACILHHFTIFWYF